MNLQKAQETQILDRMKEIVRDKEAIIQAKEGQIANLQRMLESRTQKKAVDGSLGEDTEEEEEENGFERGENANEIGLVQPSFEVIIPPRKDSARAGERPPSSRLSSARSSKSTARDNSAKQRPPSR